MTINGHTTSYLNVIDTLINITHHPFVLICGASYCLLLLLSDYDYDDDEGKQKCQNVCVYILYLFLGSLAHQYEDIFIILLILLVIFMVTWKHLC